MNKLFLIGVLIFRLFSNANAQLRALNVSRTTLSQNTIVVYGILRNDAGRPIVNANVLLSRMNDTTRIARDLTDFDGRYKLAISLADTTAYYQIRFSYLGNDLTITNVPLKQETLEINGKLVVNTPDIPRGCVVRTMCCGYRYIDPEYPGGKRMWTASDLPRGW